MAKASGVDVQITSQTKYIISTSGRLMSMQRYKILLQEILKLDIAYIPISSNSPSGAIDPRYFSYALKGMNCIGGAISRDIKHTIIPFLDEIDHLARTIQSVNTVIVRDNRLFGYNTDALGFKAAILGTIQRLNLKIETATCYGYGGVTSVVVAVLKELGVEHIYLCGRRLGEAKIRADELGVSVWSPGIVSQLFVNATPVTDKPLEEAVNFLDALEGSQVVFDHEMPGHCLQDYCSQNEIIHISGLDMYYPQMYAQW